MATNTTNLKVSNTGLTAAQQSNLQNIVNSNPGGAAAYSAGASKGSSGGGGGNTTAGMGGAVNSQGQIVGPGGQILGAANPADRYSPSAVQAESPEQIAAQTNVPRATPNIDTNQPSPDSVQTNPFTQGEARLPYEQALANLKAGGLQGTDLEQAQSSLRQSYQQAHQMVTESGAQAPVTPGAGSLGVRQAVGGVPAQGGQLGSTLIASDPFYGDLMKTYEQFISPQSQRESLTSEYEKIRQSSGLDSINSEILNTKRIIEGTEDDIRSEITAAGGFGTDSQVLALANARNKSLLKNYQTLVDTRANIQDHIDTMMNLTVQDRKLATEDLDRKLNFAFKAAEFQQRAVDNARTNYNNIIAKVGYAGLLTATNGNPYEQQLIERTLGLGNGALNQLAAIPDLEQDLSLQFKQEQIKTEQAQRANINSQIREREKTPSSISTSEGGLVDANGKPIKLTATQVDALVGFDNTVGGAGKAQALLDTGVKTGPLQKIKLQGGKLVNRADANQLDLEQTLAKIKADFMKSISGAAVSESEAKRLAAFLPEFGDQEGVIRSKLKNLLEETNKTKTNYLRTLGASGGVGNTVVAPDGNEYMIID